MILEAVASVDKISHGFWTKLAMKLGRRAAAAQERYHRLRRHKNFSSTQDESKTRILWTDDMVTLWMFCCAGYC
jgi:hypothetical protein